MRDAIVRKFIGRPSDSELLLEKFSVEITALSSLFEDADSLVTSPRRFPGARTLRLRLRGFG